MLRTDADDAEFRNRVRPDSTWVRMAFSRCKVRQIWP